MLIKKWKSWRLRRRRYVVAAVVVFAVVVSAVFVAAASVVVVVAAAAIVVVVVVAAAAAVVITVVTAARVKNYFESIRFTFWMFRGHKLIGSRKKGGLAGQRIISTQKSIFYLSPTTSTTTNQPSSHKSLWLVHWKKFCWTHKIIIYFIRGSIAVGLTSCLLDPML